MTTSQEMDAIAKEYAEDHVRALDHFPDDESKAKHSIACFVANAILSLEMEQTEMTALVSAYIQRYRDRGLA